MLEGLKEKGIITLQSLRTVWSLAPLLELSVLGEKLALFVIGYGRAVITVDTSQIDVGT